MVSLAVTGFALGVAYAAVPGAVNTESIRRSLRGGFRSGAQVQLGAIAGDGLWAFLGLTGAAVLVRSDTLSLLLGFAGASLLLWLSRQALLGALFPRHESTTVASGSSLKVGLAFGLANPAGIPFWSGIGAAIFGTTVPGAGSLAILLACFLAGAMTWGIILTYVVAWGGRHLGQNLLRFVDAVSAILLGWFGVRLLWESFKRIRTVTAPLLRALV